MKNFKEFYRRNRVYSILMLVSLVCIVSILVGVIVYFVGQTTKDKYGNRIVNSTDDIIPATDGNSATLTINYDVQYHMEKVMQLKYQL